MSEISVIVNGERMEIPSQYTVAAMIESLHLDSSKVAVERNLEIVPCDQFDSQTLAQDDQIEIVHFIGGG